MKIILDFDDTIFNTYRQFEELVKIFEQAGLTKEEFLNIYKTSKQKIGSFNPKITLNLAFEFKPFNKQKVRDQINSLLDRSKDFIYPDIIRFASSFNKKDLILLSFGNIDWQKSKIEKSKIASLFSKIIITSDKRKFSQLKIVFKKYPDEKIFFIDDQAKQIDQVKDQLPQIITMKMERPQGRNLLPKSEFADYTIKNLDQAKDIINMYNKEFIDKNNF